MVFKSVFAFFMRLFFTAKREFFVSPSCLFSSKTCFNRKVEIFSYENSLGKVLISKKEGLLQIHAQMTERYVILCEDFGHNKSVRTSDKEVLYELQKSSDNKVHCGSVQIPRKIR